VESQFVQIPPQSFDALLARKTDGTQCQTQFCGNLRVGPRRSFKKEQFHKPAALRSQIGHRFSQQLLFLRLLHQALGNRGRFRIRQMRFGIAADQPLFLALDALALVMRHLHQPFR